VGSVDRRDPCDRETESRDKLVAGESRRRRGLRGNRGHLRVPHFKTNLPTYFAHALLDSRVLAVANGGAAAVRRELRQWRLSRGCGRARVKQGEAIGRRITASGEPERSGHVAGDLCKLRRGGARDRVDNAASPVLG